VPALTLPIDGDKIGQLFKFIVRGLVWHHWSVLLGPDIGVWAGPLNRRGVEVHRSLLSKNTRQRAIGNLGCGTFIYEGAQGTDRPEMSVWLFSIFGGLTLSEERIHETSSLIGGLTASNQVLAKLDAWGVTSAPTARPRPPSPNP
jgi:hypothetical protein